MFKAFFMEENQNIDYKRIWKDEYLQWICGFANAQGGKLFIGIDDDKTIVGLKNVNHLLEDIPNKIVSTLGIVCDVNLHEQNGLQYIEIVVEPSNMPIAYNGTFHYRSGATKQQLKGIALAIFLVILQAPTKYPPSTPQVLPKLIDWFVCSV